MGGGEKPQWVNFSIRPDVLSLMTICKKGKLPPNSGKQFQIGQK